ncbi:histidine kinase dimerization/phosphoacceptor domain-containing protein [Pontiella sulfatireligans]|uniref:Signal transduction histidine kinase subgroup 3 dimerisation and phosphoacceptor domain-containing protein n=1 Tax=Pontiella sulfatireligans TaxID=2750658 RepID=A0A6C2UMB5_9BACT|nr:histidine kinase dimerization/phosphoacceptor domain-containing protein [Pontiella sulfatireligans]VGO21420.1 hypothetical protein SCARR_03493 [Pontiella sulfatireligans]
MKRLRTRQSASVALSYGAGRRKYLYVLPYECKRGKWRFACVQAATPPPDPDAAESLCACAMADDRVCLVLTDASHAIRSVSSRVPGAFGYTSESLVGMNLSDVFSEADMSVITHCSPDTNESIQSIIFQCLDGSRRDVEIKKFSAPDHFLLYGIFDNSPPKFNEELAEAGTRERRRIGQDLHDSIGQLMTGISLLSRSLANNFKRECNPGAADAMQVSDLAATRSAGFHAV